MQMPKIFVNTHNSVKYFENCGDKQFGSYDNTSISFVSKPLRDAITFLLEWRLPVFFRKDLILDQDKSLFLEQVNQ